MQQQAEQHGHALKDMADGAAVATGLAVFFQWLPAVAGILSILYTVWRLIESLEHRAREKLWPFGKFGEKKPPTQD